MTTITLKIEYPEDEKKEFTTSENAWDLGPYDLLENFIGLVRSAGYSEVNIMDALRDLAGDPEQISPSDDEGV